MADASTKRAPEEPSANGPTNGPTDGPANGTTNDSDSLEELRHLILAPEQEALERLQHRVGNTESRADDVSRVVAEAIQLRRTRGGDDALSDALSPTIESALRESVRKNPGTLADALFPVMGPAIRRSILETLRSFLSSFNEAMDQSLSWKGIQWRLEAVRTGRTFTEVALLHSLVFRVEQVFLIHKKTGLSIAHAVAPAVAMQDPSLVSGMLSAIQDFMRDSFHTAQGQGIERLNIGDLDVWVEDGPYAILACVIRGIPPRELRDTMAEVLENIHREYSGELQGFDGDTAPYAMATQELSRCLEFKFKEEPRKAGMGYAWGAAAVLLLLLAGWFGYRWWQFHRWNDLVDVLREQPGLVITSFGREHGAFAIRGLRDPLAADPLHFVTAAGLDQERAHFHWGSYYALDDAIVQQRATGLLAPPKGVTLGVQQGILQLHGAAPAKWVKEISTKALLVPGIRAVDLSGEFSPEQIAFNLARTELQEYVVKFPVASAFLSSTEADNLRTLLPELKQILNAPATLHGNMVIEVVGHSDSTGAETTNEPLSQHRAQRVVEELVKSGLAKDSLRAKGVATAQPLRDEDSEEHRQFNRSVTFRLISAP
jgi:outer membrane protein OmpA-like peptidoglycan-associated protein